jgi:hypothetical protein
MPRDCVDYYFVNAEWEGNGGKWGNGGNGRKWEKSKRTCGQNIGKMGWGKYICGINGK